MRKAIALTAASVALSGFLACRNGRPTSITSTTAAGIVTSDDAVNLLTARRCDREIDCDNVGAGKRYDDRGGCEREIAHDLHAELHPSICPYGVREEQLNDCLEALRTDSCGAPFDAMGRIAVCRAESLCVR